MKLKLLAAVWNDYEKYEWTDKTVAECLFISKLIYS